MSGNRFDSDYDSGSPSEEEKKRIVALSFECDKNKASSYQDLNQMYAFNENVDSLLYRLVRFMPDKLKKDIEKIYDDMYDKVKEIKKSNLTEQKKSKEIIETKFDYFKKLHRINTQVLPRSTIYEQDVAGELDITDDKAIDVIRGEQGGSRSEIPARFGD